jgi:uncharacterized protein (TIGR03118 family)
LIRLLIITIPPTEPLIVNIPSPDNPFGGGAPAGTAWNPASPAGEFKIFGVKADCVTPTSAPAVFLFATEDGTIVGWNPGVFPNGCTAGPTSSLYAIIAVDNSARGNGNKGKGKGNGQGAVYKGLAIATDASGATNFRRGQVEIYDGTFALLDTFTDKKAPPRYAPFNISEINGKLFVTFAVQNQERHDDVAGAGNGIVDTFDLTGENLQRFAEGGALNSPWGLAFAPTTFGDRGGTLWIGNFGDGKINAFDLTTGTSKPVNNNATGKPIVIDGLWALKFGNDGRGGSSNTLYFSAGPNGETDGLFGGLNPK